MWKGRTCKARPATTSPARQVHSDPPFTMRTGGALRGALREEGVGILQTVEAYMYRANGESQRADLSGRV